MGGRGRAVVIGAGLGGMALGLRLARAGWRVTVCEQNDRPGGKMGLWEVQGYRFDTGPSLITMPSVFEELFEALGARLQEHVELLRVEPLADYTFDDGTRFAHTASLPDWLATVRRLEGGDASGFLSFMTLGARLHELSRGTFFRWSPFDMPLPRVLGAALASRPPLRHAWGSYDGTVRHFLRSPYLRQMFDRYMTYVGSSPRRTPATLCVVPFVEYAQGVWHVRGGLYRLVEALAGFGERLGVELRTDAKVVRIDHEEGRVRGVVLESGERIDADVVVMNGDASRTQRLLGGIDRPLPAHRRSMSGLVLLFALKKELAGRPHHSVFFSSDYDAEFGDLFDRRRFPEDPTVYVNMPSRSDRSITPGRGEVMFVMANAPANDGDAWDGKMVSEARGRVLRRLSKGGFPDFENEIAASAVWTPRDMAERYDVPGGAIYGQVSHGWQGAFVRPPNRDRRMRGLYHVGGSTHPGGGTPTVLMSARITAELIGKHERT